MTDTMGAATLCAASGGGSDVLSLLTPSALRAQAQDGAATTGGDWHEEAYREAERAGDVTAMALAVLGQGGLRIAVNPTFTNETMLHRLRQLEPRFDPMSSLGLRIRARLAAEDDYRSGEYAAIVEVLNDATMAGEPSARASALSLAHHCLLGPDDAERTAMRTALAGELIRESVLSDLRTELLMGLLRQAVDLLIHGDRHAERRIGELRELLEYRDDPAVAHAVGAIEVMLAIRAGNLEHAETRAHECLERGLAMGDIDACVVYRGQISAIRWYQGRLAEVRPTLADLAIWSSHKDLSDLPRSDTWLSTLFCLVEAAYQRDDVDTCARAYELLIPYAGRPIIAGLGVLCLGSVHHALGVAALTARRLDEAVEHLRSAIDDNLALPHWPALIHSRVRYAQALTRRGYVGDISLANSVLATARREAAALDLPLPDHADELPGRQTLATCTRTGTLWRIEYGKRGVDVRDTVGMSYLAVLLADPGQCVPAVDLMTGLRALRTSRAATGAPARGGDPTERELARLAVSKAIRRTINAVVRAAPTIGAHLTETVKTGTSCCYRPY